MVSSLMGKMVLRSEFGLGLALWFCPHQHTHFSHPQIRSPHNYPWPAFNAFIKRH